jgi:hypothetical protein
VRRALEVAGLVALAALVWLVGEAAWTVRQLRPHLEVTLENIDRVTIVAGVTASEVQKGALEWQKASKAQSSATTKVLSHADAVAAQFSSFVSALDLSLTSGLIPQLQAIAQEQNSALLSNQARVGTNLDTLQQATSALRKTVQDADAQISSPDIRASLDNLSLSSKQMADGMTNLAGVTKDAKDAADYELAQLRKPASVWLGVLKFVLSYGSDARVLFTGGVK